MEMKKNGEDVGMSFTSHRPRLREPGRSPSGINSTDTSNLRNEKSQKSTTMQLCAELCLILLVEDYNKHHQIRNKMFHRVFAAATITAVKSLSYSFRNHPP
jgi:hypothetical protein